MLARGEAHGGTQQAGGEDGEAIGHAGTIGARQPGAGKLNREPMAEEEKSPEVDEATLRRARRHTVILYVVMGVFVLLPFVVLLVRKL